MPNLSEQRVIDVAIFVEQLWLCDSSVCWLGRREDFFKWRLQTVGDWEKLLLFA
ncbi:hypothetical protein [Halodesulfovibrio sp. MK-HDV]|jgi:hypothetical protein|uniref:hypothetical protein n=1 Tax=Halodesulfovibrio sp. MK-HDV TaxID=2599925 RepID=UPI00136D0BC7|nr:hypothetical protein [Halodesulfovibrio sp. MK-HDV]KAF1074117.1 hypothetical protein MKHDV_03104 [Halodesulfovibrio sp. MK-HDV]